MVAFHVTDGAISLLIMAPGNKVVVDILLVSGQCDPKVKNITEKNQVLIILFQCFKHLEKGCMITVGFANVGIGDDDHLSFFLNRRILSQNSDRCFETSCRIEIAKNIING
jgi:hypothetical protein